MHGTIVVFSASLCISIVSGALMLRTCRLPHLCVSVCVSVCVQKVFCGKAAERIRMPFGVVSRVSRGMGALDGGGDRQREGAVLGVNLGVPL